MVLGLSQNLSLYVQFSTSVKRGSKPGKVEEEKQDYYVNIGYAIWTLREEFLDTFYRELIFYIYREEAVVYINGTFFVLRELNKPVDTLKHVGITGPVVEHMEA
ncbi:DNA replication licensing factor Mcm5 [Gossypium arboreum]|uniref:Uncharacterized protein n=3 Tax=Gossypium arboreum TaxID=29729 RepID=A0ABR0MB98_GOSAR|nr:hypothetical protein PVK06_046665 [Gossypium arboreum]KHG02575.1 DNA replication licensing factor Mcm5 [Gossypium arboreum]